MTTADRIELVSAARQGEHEGWELDELPEYVRAAASKLGVRLSSAETADILREAGLLTDDESRLEHAR